MVLEHKIDVTKESQRTTRNEIYAFNIYIMRGSMHALSLLVLAMKNGERYVPKHLIFFGHLFIIFNGFEFKVTFFFLHHNEYRYFIR